MSAMAEPFYAAAARAGFRCEDISNDAVARPLLDEIEKKHFLDNAEDLYGGLGRGPVVLVRLTMGAGMASRRRTAARCTRGRKGSGWRAS